MFIIKEIFFMYTFDLSNARKFLMTKYTLKVPKQRETTAPTGPKTSSNSSTNENILM